jgi:hypothetical protein
MPGEKPRFVRGQCCEHATENSGLEDRAPHFPQKVFTKKLNSGVHSGHVTVGTPGLFGVRLKNSAFAPHPVVERNATPALRRARE